MNYLKLLKKTISHPKQYPMLRIAKLRYVFLHLFILSCILALTPMHQYYKGIHVLQSISNQQNDIPDFQIIDDTLNITSNKSKQTVINDAIIFTEKDDQTTKKMLKHLHPDVTFSKTSIFLNHDVQIPYTNLPMIHNKASLMDIIDNFSQSSFFYLMLIYFLLIMIQSCAFIFKTIFITCITFAFANVFKRKIKFMNTLKITVFLLTFPTLLVFLYNISLNALLLVLSWCIIIMLMSLFIYYLPKAKSTKIQ